MKFTKTAIFIVFLLSLLSAGATFYLSTIRENEKEKRIYLEGEKSRLESEKTSLEQKVANLEAQNQGLTQELEKEKQANQKVSDLIHKKDLELESLRGQAKEAQKAFEDAQKRNQELERILNELEERMKQAEAQKALQTSEVGYVNVSVAPVNPTSSSSAAPLPESVSQASQAVEPQAVEKEVEESTVAPVTTLPQAPKRRRFFPFFRSSSDKEKEEEKSKPSELTPIESVPEPEPVVSPIESKPSVESTPELLSTRKVEPPKEQKVETAPKASQSVAAGSVFLVNRKYNFVVTNLGLQQGLSLDDILTIQREGVEIAKARVEKLYDNYCAAYIVEEQSDKPIGEGDAVTAA